MTMQTYRIASPLDTHWRVGTCAQERCEAHLLGWTTTVDEATDLGRAQAAHIRSDRTRRHTERGNEVGLTEFNFEAGQEGFHSVLRHGESVHGHFMPIDRPELYLVDSNGSRRVHSGADAWRDDLCTNQARLAELINRG